MYLPVRALRQDEYVAGIDVPINTTTYLPLSAADALADAIHVAVVGHLTASNADTVVFNGGIVTITTAKSLNVSAAAAELLTRSAGAYTAAAAKAAMALKAADATKDRTSLVICNNTTGVYSIVDGVLATAGTSVAPACPEGSTPIAAVLVKANAEEASTITDVRPRP